MKKAYLFFWCYVAVFVLPAQTWQWANNAGSSSTDYGQASCTDTSGNYFVTGPAGLFGNAVYFKTDTFVPSGLNDIFLAKYDANGTELWVKHFGGNYNSMTSIKAEYGSAVIYNEQTNHLYVLGTFIGNCVIGSISLSGFSPSDRQLFIAKFDLAGNCIWARSAGSPGDDNGKALACFSNGDIVIGGVTYSAAVFDTFNLSHGGFIAVYDDNGNCKWVKNIFTGAGLSYGAAAHPQSIKTFQNDIFLLGQKYADTLFVDTFSFISPSVNYAVLTRMDSLGNVKWAKGMGGPDIHETGSLAIDKTGNCYIDAEFYGQEAFFETDTLVNAGFFNSYIASYDMAGNYRWAKLLGCDQDLVSTACSADTAGNVYLTGYFSGNAWFGAQVITGFTSQDLFVCRYDSSGNCLGACSVGDAAGYSVTGDLNGSCMVSGAFYNNTNFGATPLSSNGIEDIFIAKLDAITGIETIKQIAQASRLFIYPNPSAGKCTVVVPNDFLKENSLTLSIYDNLGKLMQQKIMLMNDGKIKLDIEAAAKGIYTAVLSDGKRIYTGKIVFD